MSNQAMSRVELTGTDPLLKIRNLKVRFTPLRQDPLEAVCGISFDIDKGQTVALVGESGSGKSVTALALSNLLPSSSECQVEGEIRLSGVDKNLLDLGNREMTRVRGKRIAYIFQEPSAALNPVFSIGYQIAEAIKLHLPLRGRKEIRQKVIDILDAVGIQNPEKRARDYPHQMSGGMLQRVMIAMAVVGKPDLLIADEPTTALDATIQKQIMDLLASLRSEFNMALLLITHNFGIVDGFAERVVVMRHGKIVEQNKAEELFARPSHPYTRGLLACIPKMGHRRERLVTLGKLEESHG